MWAFQTLPPEELSIDIRSENKLPGKFKLKLEKIACYRVIKDHRLNIIPILRSTPHNSHEENRQESESWKEFFPNKVAFGALCLKKVKYRRKRNLLLLKCITSFDFNSMLVEKILGKMELLVWSIFMGGRYQICHKHGITSGSLRWQQEKWTSEVLKECQGIGALTRECGTM